MDAISRLPKINGLDNPATSTGDSGRPALDSSQFLELISGLLLSSESSSSSKGSGMGESLTSMLMTVFEQMLADQIHTQETSSRSQSFTSMRVASAPPSSVSYLLSNLQSSSSDNLISSSSPHGEPVHGPLTQGFHPGHNGLDFGVVVGTPAKATMSGKVVYAGWNNQGYGNLVIVQNGPYQVYYGHLSSIPVTVGQTVSAGETIGLTGNTGHSTGPHLHYEVRKDGKPIDPSSFTLEA